MTLIEELTWVRKKAGLPPLSEGRLAELMQLDERKKKKKKEVDDGGEGPPDEALDAMDAGTIKPSTKDKKKEK
jgi:hypothetical protein